MQIERPSVVLGNFATFATSRERNNMSERWSGGVFFFVSIFARSKDAKTKVDHFITFLSVPE